MAYSYSAKANPTSQQKPQSSQQQQQAPQAAPQQQASPFKAPDMSAYAQPSGGYNAYNVPRTAPRGARQNDLSGNVPSNQVFAQAYNQASKQYGGNTQAQSFTMPGTFTSQGYNPATGQYGQMTGGQSFDGNMAYNAIDSRPSPIQASATGIGGNQMPWQDTLRQGEAFVGNLSQRLGQYSGGQLTGPVTFDQNQLLAQADEQLAKGTFSNPFSQNPDVQQAMGNATQYMQGNFQNPFGNSPQANNPQPSWDQQSYDPQQGAQFAPMVNVPQRPDYNAPAPSGPIQLAPIVNVPSRRTAPSVAQYQQSSSGSAPDQFPTPPAPQPHFYNDVNPAVVAAVHERARRGDDSGYSGPRPSRGEGSQLGPQPPRAATNGPGSAQPIAPPAQGTPYSPQAQVQGLPDVPETAPARVQYGYRAQANPVARTTQTPQPDATQAQLAKIDKEIRQWQQATYGTRTGGGPPAEWYSHIQALQRLRTKAAAGDAAALAWSPKMKAPPANVTPTVPVNRRGSAARFGGLMQNGDNRR